MIQSITVLAQVAESPATKEVGAAGVVVVGFLFVVTVLALLAAVTSALGAFFAKQTAKSAEKAARSAQAAAESLAAKQAAGGTAPTGTTASGASSGSVETGEDDPRLMAVIAAAVHTMMGDRPHRVVSVRSSGPGWAQEGRRQIFSSHRVR